MTIEIAAPAIGDQLEGGTYVGAIRVGDHVYGVIVAPKEEGETTAAWHEKRTDIAGARSFFDGAANTSAMAEAGSAVAAWARALRIGGHDDWHIPSRDELELIYRNLKPTTEANWSYRGDNPSSVPVGYAYSPDSPAQTSVQAFREGSAEAMESEWYWSSTQYSAAWAWYQLFDSGYQHGDGKDYEGRVRAVRRFLID